jgi:hypothetical protein
VGGGGAADRGTALGGVGIQGILMYRWV